ncbi:sodium:solute symporter family protein [Streptomyces johnsoniae]|uniref:Sodium:solute symporter family protein n=1 Tax=Streptomyces johnsoniae TaxID=3075532 RepID=A0ABU2S3B1_9ACTN|nr:sodium:solute symporter family protein [Streptomyces sp. DSM 41886]MDT0443483.1 sodium:solute symporter family protein [Streptomyces sp. DSM 41886]
MQTTHVLTLVLYLLLMVGIGIWFSRSKKVATSDDYLFAGRSLPRPVMIGTLLVTWVGSGTIIGGGSFAYSYGPLASIFFLAGTPVGIVVLYFLARRIRRQTTYTVPELLERRYGVTVRMIAAVITVLAYTGITAYQFTGGGQIVSLITTLSPEQGSIVVAVLVGFLAVGGGLKSVAWSDFISALIIVGSLLVALPLVLQVELGGLGQYWQDLPDDRSSLSSGLTPLQLLGYFLPLFLLLLADQNIYQRLGATRNESEARKSTGGFFLSSFLVTVPVALLGSAAFLLMPDIAPDSAVLALGSEGYLPAVLGGLLLAGALAFIVTTGSSFLLSGAGNLTYDVTERLFGVQLSDRKRLAVHRLSVLGIVTVAYVLGRFFPAVLELQMYSYTVYGVAIAPPVLAIFLWKRASKWGAMSAMVLSTVVTIVWEQLDQPYDLNAVLISLPVSLVTLVLVSLAVPDRGTRPADAATDAAPAPTKE